MNKQYDLEGTNVYIGKATPISHDELQRELSMKHLKAIFAFREEVEKAGSKHYKEYLESRRGKSLLKSSATLRVWAIKLQRRLRCDGEDW